MTSIRTYALISGYFSAEALSNRTKVQREPSGKNGAGRTHIEVMVIPLQGSYEKVFFDL